MKIQGSNPLINAYNKQLQQNKSIEKQADKTDRINISKEALKLQGHKSVQQSEREKMVDEIKEKVETGQYKIDYEETANKMMKAWSNQSY